MKTILSITLLIMFMLSCGDMQDQSINETPSETLSHEEALRILKEQYVGYSCKGFITSVTSNAFGNDKRYEERLTLFQKLEKQGLVEIEIEHTKFGYTEATLHGTQKAIDEYDAFAHGSSGGSRVIISQEEVQEVIGISQQEGEQTAQVVFTTITTETPFYILAQEKSKKKCTLDQVQEREVTFVKYDTGWRIQTDN